MVPVRLAVEPSLIARVRAEDDDADVIGFEVEGHALHAVFELDHFARLDVVEPVDAGDAVADRQHAADFGDLRVGVEIRDLVADDAGNFSGADIHVQPFIAMRESVEFGADRGVDHLAAEPDDDASEKRGIDLGVDRDVAADAGLEIGLELGDLAIVERMRRGDFGGGFAAMAGGELADRADDVLEFAQAAVLGEHAEEIAR